MPQPTWFPKALYSLPTPLRSSEILFQDISDEPRIRFGIKDPSVSFLKIIGFAFSAYHALKANYRSGKFSNASDSMTQAQLRKNWSLFAEVLMAEAGEARVHHRAFSLSRFICFLCNGSLPGNSVSDCVHVHSDISWFRRIRERDVENASPASM